MNGIIKKYHVSKNLFDPNLTRYHMGKGTNNRIGAVSNGAMFYIEATPNVQYSIKVYTEDNTFVRLYLSDEPIVEDIGNIIYDVISESETTTNPTVTITNTNYNYLWIQVGGTWYTNHGGTSIMLNEGNTALPLEPYGNTWVDSSYRRYETATDVVTSLPVKVYGDGETDISLLLKGNTETSGTPTPSNPVEVQGVGNKTANLFNPETVTAGRAINDGTGGTIAKTGYNASAYIDISEFAKISMLDTQSNRWGAFYDENKTYISGFNGYGTRTVPQNAVYVRVTVPDDYLTTFMLNGGETLLPFEPYGYKITILKDSQPLPPIYLDEPLMKIGTHTDSRSDTAETREIDKIQVKDLSWSNYDLSGVNVFRTTETLDKLYGTGTSTMLCDSYTVVASRSSIVNGTIAPYNASTDNRIIVRDDNYSTYSEFKEAMGNAWIYFVKKTPTTESVTAPEITTTGGKVTLDVDTTVKPSELDLTYHGWHEHQPLKRENGSWS